VADGNAIETGSDGSLAVLIDRNAVVEMCGHSRVSFTRNGANRVVKVDAGTVKLVVEPRAPGERMEIHTPTAIATILGTVVYVTVDPVTGATTVASVENQVNVRLKAKGSDPAGTTIDTNEQVTVGVPGAATQGKRPLDPKQLEILQACFADFHDLAVESDRIPVMARSADRAAQKDAAAGSVPPVSARPRVAPGEPGTDPSNTPFTPLIGATPPPPSPPPVDPPSDSSNF
jgi:hypothetical protein